MSPSARTTGGIRISRFLFFFLHWILFFKIYFSQFFQLVPTSSAPLCGPNQSSTEPHTYTHTHARTSRDERGLRQLLASILSMWRLQCDDMSVISHLQVGSFQTTKTGRSEQKSLTMTTVTNQPKEKEQLQYRHESIMPSIHAFSSAMNDISNVHLFEPFTDTPRGRQGALLPQYGVMAGCVLMLTEQSAMILSFSFIFTIKENYSATAIPRGTSPPHLPSNRTSYRKSLPCESGRD